MRKKWIAVWMLIAAVVSMSSCSLAQGIVIEDCGDICRGHVFSGNEAINVISGIHEIELTGVCIDVSDQDKTAAFSIERGAEVMLTLTSENTLKSGAECAGLQVAYDAVLTITEDSAGILNAYGGMKAAGIGGGSEERCGSIVILGGFVNALGMGEYRAEGGAGIGGGRLEDGGYTTISGGVVNAIGGYGGAGIGGGYSGSGGIITITGGIVNAGTAYDYISGAGIGGGAHGRGGSIEILGGVVNAWTGYYEGSTTGAGIGGGMSGSNGDIAISGGLICAVAGCDAAGIGASRDGWHGSTVIRGGFVQAYGGEWGGPGIGAQCPADSLWDEGIEISGGVTIAQGGYTQSSNPSGAGIGGFGGTRNPLISIKGGYVRARTGTGGSDGGAGIGSGGSAHANDILITGGRILATAEKDDVTRYGGAGIGGGGNGNAGDIVILGGRITAEGGGNADGIGDGEKKKTVIQIDGGVIEAYNDHPEEGAIAGNLEYGRGEVKSNGETLSPNVEAIDYAIWHAQRY